MEVAAWFAVLFAFAMGMVNLWYVAKLRAARRPVTKTADFREANTNVDPVSFALLLERLAETNREVAALDRGYRATVFSAQVSRIARAMADIDLQTRQSSTEKYPGPFVNALPLVAAAYEAKFEDFQGKIAQIDLIPTRGERNWVN